MLFDANPPPAAATAAVRRRPLRVIFFIGNPFPRRLESLFSCGKDYRKLVYKLSIYFNSLESSPIFFPKSLRSESHKKPCFLAVRKKDSTPTASVGSKWIVPPSHGVPSRSTTSERAVGFSQNGYSPSYPAHTAPDWHALSQRHTNRCSEFV
jgi:hypothetical protein